MQGSDVYILQRIIPRALDVLPVPPQVPTSGTFDNATALAVAAFRYRYVSICTVRTTKGS